MICIKAFFENASCSSSPLYSKGYSGALQMLLRELLKLSPPGDDREDAVAADDTAPPVNIRLGESLLRT